MKNKLIRATALLLAVAVSFSANGMAVLAKTVSENEAIVEECTEDTEPLENQEPETDEVEIIPEEIEEQEPNSEQDETSEDVILQEGSVSENTVQAGAGAPADPVHHCTKKNDGTDTTTWSYVYFGSYPQSEVTDSATKTAIDNAISAGNGSKAYAGTDVWVNGTKYRRISKSDTNNDGYFDEVTNNGYRYFKWERIKWRVLDNNGSTLFVVADKGLDCNDEYTRYTWENSTIREWLNNSFYNTAFSSNERNAIVAQNVVNDDNPYYGTEGGNNTTDKVYLLSIDEVINESYGFCSDCSTYSVSRRMKVSSYANARGAFKITSSAYEGNCWWWLRSPGDYSNYAAYVGSSGYVSGDGDDVGLPDGAVLPALHINLSSVIWSMTDDGTSGEGGENKKPVQTPKVNITGGTYTTAQNIILSTDTEGAEIYYTVDGSTPSKQNGIKYTGPFKISKSTTLKVIAIKDGMTVSQVITIQYIIKVANNKTIEDSDKKVTSTNTDKGDVAGSKFQSLRLKAIGKNKSVKLTWKKIKDADGYIIYGSRCGKSMKKIKTLEGKNKLSYTHTKLKKGRYYKYMVVAYKYVDGAKCTITTSKSAHAVTNGGKYGNPTEVSVKSSKITIKKGKKKKIKASYKLPKGKKASIHISKFRYESTNTKVATVTKKGVVKAKKKGTAYIYVYAQNGVYKKVKITVK